MVVAFKTMYCISDITIMLHYEYLISLFGLLPE